MTVTEFLQTNVSFLAGLTPAQAGQLASQVNQQSFDKGHTILFAGTTVEGLYVVASGKVSVFIKLKKSSPIQLVAELGPGDVFGEISILEKGTAGATIKSAEDGTLIFVIPEHAFTDILAANTEFQARVQALIASRKQKPPETPASAG